MLACAKCGQENPTGFRFCGACGASLVSAARPAWEERKLITVLFCDQVGSTAQTEELDVEDAQAMLSHYHENVSRQIERYGGTVLKFIGDAVVAIFGVPAAHEDDPERAVRAALAVREWVSTQSNLHVRMAVNTGEAFVVLGARPDYGEHLATGDVLNTASRLQEAAPVDGILIGEQTYRMTRRVIEYQELEPVRLKGKAAPVPVWEVLQARARFGSDVDQRPLHPLVGRQRELGVLREALVRCQSEHTAQLITLVGIPGIGKSRLVAELFQIADAADDVYLWRQGRSLPYGESQSFWALGEIIKAQAGILETDDPVAATGKLDDLLALALPNAQEREWVARHVQPLVGVGSSDDLGASGREEPFAAWRRLLEGMADQEPLVLVFEDLHWADEGLLDFVDYLADWATASRILIVGTARPELLDRRPGWGGGKRNAATISISPLTHSDTARLLSYLLDQALLPAEIHAAVLSLAGGNPLYAEEYVRMLQDRGLLHLDGSKWRLSGHGDLPFPDTIQSLVAARIDSLSGPEKELLRDASVVGKVFWPAAVAALESREAVDFPPLLHALERKEFIRRERRSAVEGETQYAFLHALVREVAYRQIPRAERAHKHVKLAGWIEALAAQRADDRLEMLAHHYLTACNLLTSAGRDVSELVAPTRIALSEASERAARLNAWSAARDLAHHALQLMEDGDPSAPALAVRLARTSLNLAENDVETAERATELSLRQGDAEHAAEAEGIRSLMLWERGQGMEALSAADHSLELVVDLPASPAKVWALANRARRACLLEDHDRAHQLTEEALPMAAELGREDHVSDLLNTRGMSRVFTGDPRGVEDLEQAVDLAERATAGWMLATAQNNLAQVLWALGRIEDGAKHIDAYRQTASRFGMQSLNEWADAEEVYLAYIRGEYGDLISRAERWLATRHGNPSYIEGPQQAMLGHAYVTAGRLDEALSCTQRGLLLGDASADPQNLGLCVMARAHALASNGDMREAHRLLDRLLGDARLFKSLMWLAPLSLVLHEHGRSADCALVYEAGLPSRWRDAAKAVADDRLVEAAQIYARIGSHFVSAWALLLAAERGSVPSGALGEAAAHFRRVGAAQFLARVEQLNRASA